VFAHRAVPPSRRILPLAVKNHLKGRRAARRRRWLPRLFDTQSQSAGPGQAFRDGPPAHAGLPGYLGNRRSTLTQKCNLSILVKRGLSRGTPCVDVLPLVPIMAAKQSLGAAVETDSGQPVPAVRGGDPPVVNTGTVHGNYFSHPIRSRGRATAPRLRGASRFVSVKSDAAGFRGAGIPDFFAPSVSLARTFARRHGHYSASQGGSSWLGPRPAANLAASRGRVPVATLRPHTDAAHTTAVPACVRRLG